MAIDQTTMDWHYSGGSDNTLGSASFGGARAENQGDDNLTWSLESTVTTGTAADKRIVIDTAQIGAGADAHVGKAMLMVDGNAALDAGRIVAFDDATGVFTLEAPFTAVVTAGDTYQLYEVDDMIDSVNAADCASGSTDYRLVYLQNNSGIAADKTYFFIKIIGGMGQLGAAVEIELWGRISQGTSESTVADDEAGPPAAQLLSNDRFAQGPLTRLSVESTPALPFNAAGSAPLLSDNVHRALWIKRIVPPNARRNDFVVVQITAEFESGDDQTIVSSSMLLVFSMEGFTPLIDILPDRGPTLTEQQLGDGYDASIRVGHGARMIATVRALETGLPVPDLEIGWTLSGPGQLFVPEGPLTDSLGIARTTYSAPDQDSATRQAIVLLGLIGGQPVNNLTVISVEHTVESGTERALYVAVTTASDDNPPADLSPYQLRTLSVTYAGIRLDIVGSVFSVQGGRIDIWQLLSPPVGTADVVATLPLAPEALGISASSRSGVDQINPLDASPSTLTSDNDPSALFSIGITTQTPGAVMLAAFCVMNPVDFTITTLGPDHVNLNVIAVGISPLAGGTTFTTKPAIGTGPQTMDFDDIILGSDRLVIAIALRPALTNAIVAAQV